VGVCLGTASLAKLNPAPASLSAGKALLFEQLDSTNQWGLVLYNLDGSGKQVLVSDGSEGSFSPDGSQVAYPAQDGIHLLDLATKAKKVLAGAGGFDLHWSPDGKQIAYVGGSTDKVFVVNIDGTPARQISDLSYELVVGWSPDSAQLYFVIPFTGGAAWKVYSFDLAGGKARELFTIENGTPKALDATLSPDGKWIAYRGRDNSGLYLVHPDGSDMHLLLDNIGDRTAAWSRSGWLGASLDYNDETRVVLLKPDGCEAYLLPALHGDLEGLSIP
jgi:Tol biopolymer transport system component